MLPGVLRKEEGTCLAEEVEELEVEKTLRNMAKYKTPGGDGIPVEFYQKFWAIIKTHFLEVIRCCRGLLSQFIKKGMRRMLKIGTPDHTSQCRL